MTPGDGDSFYALSLVSADQLDVFVKMLRQMRKGALRKYFSAWHRMYVGCTFLDERWARRLQRARDAEALLLSIESPKVLAAALD